MCCSDIITEFNQKDIINFYLNRGLLNSLSKTRIKSRIKAAFIETLDYLASITLNKCNLISSARAELLSVGLPPAFKKLIIVNPTKKELKLKIKDHVLKTWIKDFNSNNHYLQTKLFITEPQDFISKELLALPRVTAKKVVSL